MASRGEAREFVEWARSAAVHLDGDPAGWSPAALTPLDRLVEGRRLAFVGEANHFVHEKYAYRTLVLRYLASRGFDVVCEELAWSDGLAVDAYVQSGDESSLDRVTAYGYRPGRDDRDDSPTGVLAGGEDGYPRAAFRAAQIGFARTIREVSSTMRLRVFGFDADYVPDVGYEYLETHLAKCPDGASFADVRRLFARVPGESREDECLRLMRACDVLDGALADAREALPRERWVELLRTAWTLRDSYAYASAANHAPDYEALREPMAARERLMWSHAEHVLNHVAPSSRAMFFSHNLHLARDDSKIPASGGVGPGGGLVPSVGTHLSQKYPGQVFSIWMLEASGADSQPFEGLTRRIEARPGSLNALLAEVGEAFVLPLSSSDSRARVLREPMPIVMMYGSEATAAVAEQADAVFFVREVSPLREPV